MFTFIACQKHNIALQEILLGEPDCNGEMEMFTFIACPKHSIMSLTLNPNHGDVHIITKILLGEPDCMGKWRCPHFSMSKI